MTAAQTFWQSILDAILPYLAMFGEKFINWLKGFWAAHTDPLPEPDIIRVGAMPGAAPPDVISALKQLIADTIAKAFVNRPFIAKILSSIVMNLPSSFIDKLWDSIFAAKIAAGELPSSATFPKVTMAAAPVQVSASDLAQCHVEAGLAA